MDSLKISLLLKTCFCPTKKEMNWNDLNYHTKDVGSSCFTLQHLIVQLNNPTFTKLVVEMFNQFQKLLLCISPALWVHKPYLAEVFLLNTSYISSVRSNAKEETRIICRLVKLQNNSVTVHQFKGKKKKKKLLLFSLVEIKDTDLGLGFTLLFNSRDVHTADAVVLN